MEEGILTLRIRTVARLTGVREATLRAWERRYGFPTPERGANNYRAYSREEAEAIRRVSRLVAQGYAVSEAISVVRSVPTSALPVRERVEERFWSAVMVLDERGATEVLDEAQRSMTPLQLTDDVLMPLLRKMSQRLDVAREHLASAAIRQKLRWMLEHVPAPDGGPTAVLACPPRDQHEGGLLSLGLHLRMAGWKVVVLGADTPASAVSAAAKDAHAHLVALSFVRHYGAEEFESVVRDVSTSVEVPVVVGGPGAQEHLSRVGGLGAHFAGSAAELRFTARTLGIAGA